VSIEQDREYFYLNQLAQAPGQTLKKFAGTKANPKELGLDAPVKKSLEAGLVERGFITVAGKGAAKQFTLTPSGLQHLGTLEIYPRREPPNPKMKAFVLMVLLSAGDGQITPKQIKSQLTPAVSKSLGFSKDALTPLLQSLLSEHAITQSATDSPAKDEQFSYRLTDAGKREVVRNRQHADAVFKLTGSVINQIIEYAAGMSGAPSAPAHAAQQHPGSGSVQRLTEDELIREAKGLMPALGRNGLLPIFEFRRHIRRKFGEHAVSHEEFDSRLKRMRGVRLDLVSVAEPSLVGSDELREAVQGAGELFFYVRDLR